LVEVFDVNQELAHKTVRKSRYVMELNHAVYRSEEQAIEPAATLRDQFWDLRGTSDQSFQDRSTRT